jgi:hypothetical protein
MLAQQTMRLIQTPGRSFASLTSRFSRYRGIINGILGSGTAKPGVGNNNSLINSYYLNDLFAVGAVSGAAVSSVSSSITPESISSSAGEVLQSRSETLSAADEILSMLDDVTVWRENNSEALSLIDTGETYQAMHNVATLAAASLVQLSFGLKQERSVVLTESTSMINLEFILYGTVYENLDLMIKSNNLTGSEILELPRGKEILYYV